MKINLTSRQVNFISAFEAVYGRPTSVTRATLLAFKASWTRNQVGPFGHTLRWPAWLTNSGTFTETRAVYNIPWDAYDQYLATNKVAEVTVASNA